MTATPTAHLSGNMSGLLLVAHPDMRDSSFAKSVILVSVHSPEDGSLGVILNRPLNVSLGQANPDFAYSALADVPLYRGGPCSDDQIILTAWEWSMDRRTFRFYFGIDQDKATAMYQTSPNVVIRGFLGYSGWGTGQLEQELKEQTWLTTALRYNSLESREKEALWQAMVGEINPDLSFQIHAPDDPSLN